MMVGAAQRSGIPVTTINMDAEHLVPEYLKKKLDKAH